MAYSIEYYSDDVQVDLLGLPTTLRARYLALSARMERYGPNLGIVMLHSFVKKTDKTPLKERRLAERRLKEIKDENTQTAR